jgi:hypothetical protein
MHATALIRATGLTVLLASLGVIAPARAATTVGNNLDQDRTPSPTVSVCDGSDTTCTVVPKSLIPANQAAGGLVAVSGVVVRWRVKSAAQAPNVSVALRVVRGGDTATGLGRSDLEGMTSQPAPIFTFPTRLPVAAGDRLGVEMSVPAGATSAPIAATTTSAGSWDRWQPALGFGETRRRTSDKPFELLLNADIEPDADADGWGDETQDNCPGSAGPVNGCAPPPPPPAPPPPPPPAAVTPPAQPLTPGPSTSPTVPSTPAALIAGPRITRLQFSATRVRFRISDPAAVTLTVHRVLPGRKRGTRCLKPTARNRRARSCTRLMRALSGRTNVEPGLNTARLLRLVPGRYRLRLVSRGLTGGSTTVTRYYRLRR